MKAAKVIKKENGDIIHTDIMERWKGLDLRLLPIDEIDIRIMSKLMENARMSNSEIAKDLKMSEATVRRRIKNLVEKRIVRGFSIFIDYRLIENTVKAYIHIKVQSDMIDKVLRKIGNHKRVVALYRVTGHYDLMLVTLFVGMSELQEFIDSFLKTEGVKEVETQIIMTAYKGVPWTGY
jgi:Lrp/AsnC family transcriptional regulator for asnA, asnC and gidA